MITALRSSTIVSRHRNVKSSAVRTSNQSVNTMKFSTISTAYISMSSTSSTMIRKQLSMLVFMTKSSAVFMSHQLISNMKSTTIRTSNQSINTMRFSTIRISNYIMSLRSMNMKPTAVRRISIPSFMSMNPPATSISSNSTLNRTSIRPTSSLTHRRIAHRRIAHRRVIHRYLFLRCQ